MSLCQFRSSVVISFKTPHVILRQNFSEVSRFIPDRIEFYFEKNLVNLNSLALHNLQTLIV